MATAASSSYPYTEDWIPTLYASTGTAIQPQASDHPKRFALNQNYPNPFNPSTRIEFELKETGLVTLKVYNLVGREVATLVNSVKNAGTYSVRFDAGRLSSGCYFYVLHAGQQLVKKMIVIK
jgi:hypothetical protein